MEPPVRPSLQVEKLEDAHGLLHETEAIDWRGRPATDKQGGSRTSFFILSNQGLWNIANLAVATNLVLYFVEVLQMSNAEAANNVTNWFGTQWLLTLLGGFLGDSYLGRLWTCTLFQVLHVLGLVLLSLSVTLPSLKPAACTSNIAKGIFCPKPGAGQVGIFMVAIYIIALGSGGYLPAFVALGADQFESEAHKTTYFGWLFFFQNVGSIFANTVFVYIENKGMWAMAYWVSTGVGILALLLFGVGTPTFRQYRLSGNPFTRVAQVAVATFRKRRVAVPQDSSQLHEVSEKELVRCGSRKMVHTPKFRFLDKAATKTGGEEEEGRDPWRLCSVTQVEEMKCLFRMVPIWLTAILFSVVFSQIFTLFVEQAVVMDTRVGSFNIPPASMSVFNVASIFLMTVLYPVTVVPVARLVTGRKEGLTHLQRMAVGQLGSAFAMALAAVVETKRLQAAHRGFKISVFWVVPQQVILGATQVFVVVGAMNFFYSEAPHSMRGLVSSLSLANLAIGSYASSILVSATMHFTTKGGKPGWIPPNLNVGHVDYFYWLLAGLTLLNTIVFILGAWWYHKVSPTYASKHQQPPNFPCNKTPSVDSSVANLPSSSPSRKPPSNESVPNLSPSSLSTSVTPSNTSVTPSNTIHPSTSPPQDKTKP